MTNCGDGGSGSESCCTSLGVVGGTYSRTYVNSGGGAAGLVGANLLLSLLNRWQRAAEVHLAASVDARVYLAGLALTLGSALLFGMIPARQAWQSSPLQVMKSGPADAMHGR